MSRAAHSSSLALMRLGWKLPILARLRWRLAIESVVVVATTAAYALLSGGSLPALRTLAMVAALAALRWLRRCLPLHQMLALAALVLVAFDPLALTSAGFWLSFVATATLLAVLSADSGWRGAACRLCARAARDHRAPHTRADGSIRPDFPDRARGQCRRDTGLQLRAPARRPGWHGVCAGCACSDVDSLARACLAPRRRLATSRDQSRPGHLRRGRPRHSPRCSSPLPEPCCSRPCYCRSRDCAWLLQP